MAQTTFFQAHAPTARLRKAEEVFARLEMKPEDAVNLLFAMTTTPEPFLFTAEQGKVWEKALGEY